jgi:hypothetical protein
MGTIFAHLLGAACTNKTAADTNSEVLQGLLVTVCVAVSWRSTMHGIHQLAPGHSRTHQHLQSIAGHVCLVLQAPACILHSALTRI